MDTNINNQGDSRMGMKWHSSQLKTVALAVFSIAVLIWAAGQLKAYKFIGSNLATTRSITVSGEGKRFVRADLATVQFTISTEAGTNNLATVQDKNSSIANAVIGFAKSQGVKDEDIKTTNYSIFPRYNYSQKGQEFLGYTIRQDVQLKIRDLAKVGAILNGVVGEGANEVSNLQFTVDDPKKPQDEARDDAIADAKAKADKLAKQLGVKLVRVMSYSENTGGQPPIYFSEAAYSKGMGGGGPAPDIQTGQNEIKSFVSLTYEIE